MESFPNSLMASLNGVCRLSLQCSDRCQLLPSQLFNLDYPLSVAEPPVGRAPPPSLCPANAAHAHIRVVVFAAPLVPLFHGMHVLAVLQLHLLPRPEF